MARWQFRRTKSFGPFRFSLSRGGVGASIGFGPFRISRGADGKWRRTTRVAGLWKTERIGDDS